MMRRRVIIAGIGSAAAWPLTAWAQQTAMSVVGLLHSGSANQTMDLMVAFRQGLRESGYVEGENVVIQYRWADGNYDRLPALAADLVARRVAVIATGGGAPPPIAAKSATKTIPIVFSGGSDPITNGLVYSLNQPGGNVTGVLNIASELTAKRLDLLRALVPAATTIAVLRNPANPEAAAQLRDIQVAVRQMARQIHITNARRGDDIEPAFATLAEQRPGALFVASDPFFAAQRNQLIALAARHAIPAIYPQRQYAEAGGLMSYGTNFQDVYRQGGIYVGRILKGEKPANLPIMRPTKFEMIINLKTAKTLGLTVSDSFLLLADEVIE